MKYRFLLVLSLLLSGCSVALPTITQDNATSPVITPSPTLPSPSTATFTPSPTSTSTPLPTSTPVLPVEIAQPLAAKYLPLTVDNMVQLRNVASWGHGKLYSLHLTPDGNEVLAFFKDTVMLVNLKETSRAPISLSYLSLSPYFSIDGTLVGGIDYIADTFSIYQLPGGKLISYFPIISGSQFFVSQDLHYILSGNTAPWAGGETRIYDAYTGKMIFQINNSSVAALSPDGSMVASYSSEQVRTVTIYRTADGTKVSEFLAAVKPSCPTIHRILPEFHWNSLEKPSGSNELYCMIFAPDSRHLVISGDRATQVWDVQANQETKILSAGRPSFSEDGKFIILEQYSSNYSVYQTADWNRVISLNENYPLISPDGKKVASVWINQISERRYDIGGLVLHDMQSGRTLVRLPKLQNATFSQDGSFIAASQKGEIAIVDAVNGKELFRLSGEYTPTFLTNNQYLVTAGSNGKSNLWSLPEGKLMQSFIGSCPGIIADGKTLFTLTPGQAHLYNLPEVGRADHGDEIPIRSFSFPIPVANVTFHPDGKTLIEYSSLGVRWINMADNTVKAEFPPGSVFNPDYSLYAIPIGTHVDIRSTATNELQQSVESGSAGQIRFSPNGEWLAVANPISLITLFNLKDGKKVAQMAIASSDILQIEFTSDSKKLFASLHNISSYRKASVSAWNLPSGNLVKNWAYSCDYLSWSGWPLRILPDEEKVIFGANDCKMQVVQYTDWTKVLTFPTEEGYYAITALSTDGKIFAESFSSNKFTLFEVGNSYKSHQVSLSSRGYIDAINFSPDNTLLSIVSGDGVQLWAVP